MLLSKYHIRVADMYISYIKIDTAFGRNTTLRYVG